MDQRLEGALSYGWIGPGATLESNATVTRRVEQLPSTSVELYKCRRMRSVCERARTRMRGEGGKLLVAELVGTVKCDLELNWSE